MTNKLNSRTVSYYIKFVVVCLELKRHRENVSQSILAVKRVHHIVCDDLMNEKMLHPNLVYIHQVDGLSCPICWNNNK